MAACSYETGQLCSSFLTLAATNRYRSSAQLMKAMQVLMPRWRR